VRSNVVLWWILAVFFLLVGGLYIGWNIVAHPQLPWYNAIEWVGAVALIFSFFMAAFIAFYLGRVHKAQGGELPEDILTADIDDGDPELGHFSPWSWWPIVLGAAAGLAMLGLAIGSWLMPIGLAVFVIAIVGWVYEYYRGYFAH